jgi:hypothetical protein
MVITVILYGFFVAGSPFKRRLIRLDQQKVNHLWSIQSAIIEYWKINKHLPNSLDQLVSESAIPPVLISPDIVYKVNNELSFELCAKFNLPSEDLRIGPGLSGAFDNWNHGAGFSCFTRKIDPSFN